MSDTAVLLIDCPDRKGLVARVAGLLYEHGANILHADQHQDHDLGLFFMRVEWGLTHNRTDKASAEAPFDLSRFTAEFAKLASDLTMRWTLNVTTQRPRVALFCSQYLHCVADLLHRWRAGELSCDIPLIVS